MLQIASGRFFRPGVPLNETVHRRTVYRLGAGRPRARARRG
jgi:hypothetical protein